MDKQEEKWWEKYLLEADIQANNTVHKNFLLREKLLKIIEKNKQYKESFENIVSVYKKENKKNSKKEKIWEDKTKDNHQILKELVKSYSFSDSDISADMLESTLQFLNNKFSSYNDDEYDSIRHILSEISDNPKYKQCSFETLKQTYLNFGKSGSKLEAFLLRHKDCKEDDLFDFTKKIKNEKDTNTDTYEEDDDDDISKHKTSENRNRQGDKPELSFWENICLDEKCSSKLRKTILDYELINLNIREITEHLYDKNSAPSLKLAIDLLNDSHINYADETPKTDLLKIILSNPACTAEVASYAIEKTFPSYFYQENLDDISQFIREKCSFAPEVEQTIKKQKNKFQHQEMLKEILDDNAPESKIEVFVKYAHKVVQSGDAKKINRFKEILFSYHPDSVYDLDKKAMAWWVKNGTKENLEALNSFSSFYGMTTEVAEYSCLDTTIPRAIFEGSIRPVSKYTQDRDENPYYEYKHSQAFLEDKCEFNLEEHPELPSDKPWTIYDLSQNIAYQEMKKANINFPEEKLQQALWEGGYHPDTIKQFNVSDLTHVYCEQKGIDLAYGRDRLPLQDYNENAPQSVREECWQEIGKNKELVKFISDNLREKGISEDTISQIWSNVEENGSPCNDRYGNRNVWGVSLQIHHFNALKDGGKNQLDNFTVVMDIREAYFDDEKGYWKDGGNVEYNSHQPNHLFDQPLIFLYKDGNKVVQAEEERTDMPRVKVMRHPVSPTGEHVVCYMGPEAKDCCVGSISGNVHQIEEYVIGKKQQKPVWQIGYLNQGRVR